MIGAARCGVMRSAGGGMIASVSESGVVGYPFGPVERGILITVLADIVGSGFTGATAVAFGGTAAVSFTVVSDALITASIPTKSAGTYDVTVTTPGGVLTLPNSFTYLAGGTINDVEAFVVGGGGRGQDGSGSGGGDAGLPGQVTTSTVTFTQNLFLATVGSDSSGSTSSLTNTGSTVVASGGGTDSGTGGSPSGPGTGTLRSTTSSFDGVSRRYAIGGVGGNYFEAASGINRGFNASTGTGPDTNYGRGGNGGQANTVTEVYGEGTLGGNGVVMIRYPLSAGRFIRGGAKSVVTIGGVPYVLHTFTDPTNPGNVNSVINS